MSAASSFQSPPPDVAIEIDSTHVAAARLTWRGPTPAVAGHVIEPLPSGAVVPSLAATNIADIPMVGRAVSQALARLGRRVRRAALVIPDTVTKVSLIRFDNVPANVADLTELVRWQVRKSAPFPIEQAAVSFTAGARVADGGQEFVVTIARTDIVEEYEQACARAGVHAGLVDIATFSIINSVLAEPSMPTGDPSTFRPFDVAQGGPEQGPKATSSASSRARSRGDELSGGSSEVERRAAWSDDWLLVHATALYTTLVVLRGGDVIFFRNREQESEGTLADVVHQTAMYYEDRLKGAGFSRVLLAGGAVQAVDAVRRSLEQRLDVRIESVAQPDLAPLLGILVRERKAA